MKANERSANTPVVALTAEDDTTAHLRVREPGAAAVVAKPISIDDLGTPAREGLAGRPIDDVSGPAGDADLRGMGSVESPDTPQ